MIEVIDRETGFIAQFSVRKTNEIEQHPDWDVPLSSPHHIVVCDIDAVLTDKQRIEHADELKQLLNYQDLPKPRKTPTPETIALLRELKIQRSCRSNHHEST